MISRLFRLAMALRPSVFWQFVRFAVVGSCNTVVDFGTYVALTRGTDYFSQHIVLAATAAFLCAVSVSFMLNSLWTFERSMVDWRSRAPRFLLIALGGLAINAGVLALLVALGTHDIIAKLAASAASIAWNFPMHRRWTFGK